MLNQFNYSFPYKKNPLALEMIKKNHLFYIQTFLIILKVESLVRNDIMKSYKWKYRRILIYMYFFFKTPGFYRSH